MTQNQNLKKSKKLLKQTGLTDEILEDTEINNNIQKDQNTYILTCVQIRTDIYKRIKKDIFKTSAEEKKLSIKKIIHKALEKYYNLD